MQCPDPTPRNAVRAALDDLERLVHEAPSDLGDLEVEVMNVLMEAGRAVVREVLTRSSPTEAFEENGTTFKPVVRGNLLVTTLFGEVRVPRWRFRSGRSGASRCLVSERAGLLGGRWTPQAAKVASMAAAEMPYDRVMSFFEEVGAIRASRTSLLRLVGDLHDVWEAERPAHEQAVREGSSIPEKAKSLAVSLDGVMVAMLGSDRAQIRHAARARGAADKGPAGFSEASVGVITFYDSDGERVQTRRYARMPEPNKVTTKAWLTAELKHIRQLRPDLTTVALADGAANNWSFLVPLDMDVELVDFFHTAEHLHRHISQANGASSLHTQETLRVARQTLLTVPGAAPGVGVALHLMRENAGTAAASTQKTHGKRQPTFFERHSHRMDYPDARARNLPIGTGVTESTCKLAVCARLRGTGMRWSERGGQAILTLRALLRSDQFEAGWNLLRRSSQTQLAA